MKITFVNHSSFIIDYKKVKLVCDPWMEGTAFNNGWGLLSKTQLQYEDFKDITHIWFSHEHPDHFSPPNMFKIPQEYREKITVLYQETVDEKVIEFCKKLQFKEQIELKANEYHTIFEDLTIMCNPYTEGDSYAVFKTNKHKILNLNDCLIRTREDAEELAKLTGEVDVLFSQFGYSKKVGNIDGVALREAASQEKLDRFRFQSESLKPKVIVPFATFVYFCHEENRYNNVGMKRIDEVASFIENEMDVKCNVLYPNDSWNIDEEWDSTNSIQQYMKDYAALENSIEYIKAPKIELDKVIEQSKKLATTLSERYPQFKEELSEMDANVYITDYNKSFRFSVPEGLVEADIDYDFCDVATGSECLFYGFKHLWGIDTMNINARFQVPKCGYYPKFKIFGDMASCLNRDEPLEKLEVTNFIIT